VRRAAAAVLIACAAACAPEKIREFELGLLGPAGPGVAAAARAAGMAVREAAPEGAAVEAAGEARMANGSRLRLLTARAAVSGKAGIFFVLPKAHDGREVSDYPEEWQALVRVARETAALRPILERGVEAAAPFPAPAGVSVRAWRHQGRLYVLLVNESARPAPIDPDALRPWRALFEVRSDARDLLVACGAGQCLSGERALWLEGRL